MKPVNTEMNSGARTVGANIERAARPDLKDPGVVLSLLEADQVVAAKQRTHFGRRGLSLGVRVLLWGLRVYVVVMIVIVLISAIRAIQ